MNFVNSCEKKGKSVWSFRTFTVHVYFSYTVDADEIKRLGKRFRKLDLDNSGALSVDEFMSLPELQQNPLVQRVIDIFDTDGNGEVDFKGMLYLCQKQIQLLGSDSLLELSVVGTIRTS